MWLFALAALGIIFGGFLAIVAMKKARTESAWDRLEEKEEPAVPVGIAEHREGTKQISTEALGSPKRQSHLSAASPVATGKELWVNGNYYWVVVCKNHWFHRHPNIFNVHRIPLGETDSVLPRPSIDSRFSARCDECGKQYVYKRSEVLRYEMEVAASFVPHPLFKD
jgi:hypothetical protein